MPCHRIGYDRRGIHVLASVEREKKNRKLHLDCCLSKKKIHSVWTFQPAKQRSRPRACRNKSTYCPMRSSKVCFSASAVRNIAHQQKSDRGKKSEVALNPKISLFSEGQRQFLFRRIMHGVQELKLRLWRSGFLSWVPLEETLNLFRNAVGSSAKRNTWYVT